MHVYGLSTTTLSQLVGLSYGRLRRLIAGRCDPPLADALQIALVLATPVDELFELVDADRVGLRGDRTRRNHHER
jgi:hypothetical protein